MKWLLPVSLMGTLFLAAVPAKATSLTSNSIDVQTPSKGRVSFLTRFQGLTTDLPLITTSVVPNGSITFHTPGMMASNGGALSRSGESWTWRAPQTPGLNRLSIQNDGQTQIVNVFVLTPFENGQTTDLDGYKVGTYSKTLFRGLQTYAEPKGFINLAHGPSDMHISPNFKLRQFISKQQPGHDPSYILVRPELLIKLETLLEAARAKGWQADTLHIMSGFRTPHYNRSIGNKTTSSRHLYGGAADIWIDGDRDGRMDDLNNDGQITKADARVLANLAEELAQKGGHNWPKGGIGIYGPNAVRGPFVHIDARGYAARWGQ